MTRSLAVSPQPRTGPYARRRRMRNSLVAEAEPLVWLTGGALAFALFMIVGLLGLILVLGSTTFWPRPLVLLPMRDGRSALGEIVRTETFRPGQEQLAALAGPELAAAQRELDQRGGQLLRRLVRTGNFDLTNSHFQWIDNYRLRPQAERQPDWALVVERQAWGRFYGTPVGFAIDDRVTTDQPAEVWRTFQQLHPAMVQRRAQQRELELHAVGRLNREIETARLALRQIELRPRPDDPAWQQRRHQAAARLSAVEESVADELAAIRRRIDALVKENSRYALLMQTADGRTARLAPAEIVRAYPANQLSLSDKLAVYLSRWVEFLTAEPREANSEGGVLPAIFGTVAMTLLMSLAVVPFGVLAALYLREYSKGGLATSIVRIAINNLAGVPSIVFGVFGLGFFCYAVGGFIDGGSTSPAPPSSWALGMAVLAAIAVLAAAAGAVGFSGRARQADWPRRAARIVAVALALVALVLAAWLVQSTPHFDGFYEARLPSPTFGKGALLWASLTLALMTLPVVIVATEEALAAVPSSMREGSYACGASKWQTVRRIVLPRAMPGVMTGMILAMARGAGEVAPLMLVGAVKVAPELPLDMQFPFIHLERSFMHLGFHIYDLGFQSQNSEAAKPMVFTTTLLLIAIIAFLNLSAVYIRGRLRRRFMASHF